MQSNCGYCQQVTNGFLKDFGILQAFDFNTFQEFKT